MLKYNLCFIRRGDKLLMLNRAKAPLCGLWHGVGGKLEADETPYASVLREVQEETGLSLAEVRFAGIVTWETSPGKLDGMYVYIAELPEEMDLVETPAEREEGILAWKPVDWVIRPENHGVPEHVRHFLPLMLEGAGCFDYRCSFHEDRLLRCQPMPLDEANEALATRGAGTSKPAL
jgi:8-oxo-dGTP diphosphatase